MALECKDVIEKLSAPGTQSGPEVLAHLSACADCREAHAALQAVERTRHEPDELVLTGFAARVAANGKRRRSMPTWLGAAAASAIAATAVFGLMRTPVAPESIETAARTESLQQLEEPPFAAEFASSYLFDEVAWDEEAMMEGSLEGELARLEQMLDFGDEGSI